jgi:hypothetical protein
MQRQIVVWAEREEEIFKKMVSSIFDNPSLLLCNDSLWYGVNNRGHMQMDLVRNFVLNGNGLELLDLAT